MDTAKEFWLNADMGYLAEHWNYEKKLPYDIQAIIPHLHDVHFVWDGACGDMRITDALKKVFLKTLFTSTDIKTWDLTEGVFPPSRDADTVLLLGVIQYLDDESVKRLFSEIRDKKVIIRSACGNDEHINKYSKELKGRYEAYYRSVKSVKSLILPTHNVAFMGRVYPEKYESKFGTRQYLFVGEPCVV